MVKLNRVLQNSTLYLFGNLASRAVGFLAIPFYSRFLSPTEFGVIELIELSTEIIAIALGVQAIGQALTRVFHEQRTLDQERAVISTGLIASALLSGTIAAFAIMAAAPLSRAVFHVTDQAPLMRAAFVAMFFANLVEVILVYERIRERAKFFLAYSLVTLFVNLALNIYFIGFAHAGVWGFIFSKLIVTTAGSIYLISRAVREVGVRWRQSLIPEFVRFGAPLAISGLAFFLIHFSDRFFLTSAVSLADLGRYALAYRFAFLVSILVGDSFGKSWNVTFYRYAEEDGWRQQFGHVASFLMFVLCAAALGISTFAPELLRFMVPPDFYPPFLLLPLLVFSYVFREVGDFFRNLLLINKRSGLVGQIATGGAAINVLFNFLLIPLYGIYGAALATLGTWVAYLAICWVLAYREHRVPVRLGSFLLIVVLTVGVYAMSEALRTSGYVAQVLLDGMWVVVFALLSIVLFFTPVERSMLRDGAAALLSRVLTPGAAPPEPPAADHKHSRMLMLAYFYPPENASGAARPHRFARYLRPAGHEVSVVSGNPRDLPPHPEGDPAPVRVPLPTGVEQRLRQRSAAIRAAERLVLPYDDRLTWVPHAIAASARRLEREQIDVLFSSHPPVATHIAALTLKRRYNVPWIADFRDPLFGNPFRTARRSAVLDPVLERLIFRNADAVIANTDAVADAWRERYPEWAHKIHLIWNGFDPADVIVPLPPRTEERRVLTHVGTLYGGRTPQPIAASLLRLLEAGTLAPEQVTLRLVGPVDSEATDLSAPPFPELTARGSLQLDNRMVPQQDARRAMLEADVLLLLDMNGQNAGLQVPAKIFEYVRACRPIFAISPAGSATARILARSGIPHVCVDPAAPEAELDAALAACLRAPRATVAPSPAFFEEFDARLQTEALIRIIQQVRRYRAEPERAPPPETVLPAAIA
jgi:O-antigen/teichoic acid export membrane protein/glycosyltransferase involved in cell wall biosynthesis